MAPVTALPQFPWLSLLIGLPLAGALLCLLQRRSAAECRGLALATTVATLAVSVWLFAVFGGGAGVAAHAALADHALDFGQDAPGLGGVFTEAVAPPATPVG